MKTRIICMRFPHELIQRLDNLCPSWKHRSRSFVAIQLLDVLTQCADKRTLEDMLTTWDAYGDGYVVRFGKPQK